MTYIFKRYLQANYLNFHALQSKALSRKMNSNCIDYSIVYKQERLRLDAYTYSYFYCAKHDVYFLPFHKLMVTKTEKKWGAFHDFSGLSRELKSWYWLHWVQATTTCLDGCLVNSGIIWKLFYIYKSYIITSVFIISNFISLCKSVFPSGTILPLLEGLPLVGKVTLLICFANGTLLRMYHHHHHHYLFEKVFTSFLLIKNSG